MCPTLHPPQVLKVLRNGLERRSQIPGCVQLLSDATNGANAVCMAAAESNSVAPLWRPEFHESIGRAVGHRRWKTDTRMVACGQRSGGGRGKAKSSGNPAKQPFFFVSHVTAPESPRVATDRDSGTLPPNLCLRTLARNPQEYIHPAREQFWSDFLPTTPTTAMSPIRFNHKHDQDAASLNRK